MNKILVPRVYAALDTLRQQTNASSFILGHSGQKGQSVEAVEFNEPFE